MGKIIAFANQKGGVGKTTSCVNIAASLGILGHKVLIIDLDPQGNTTSGVGISKKTLKTSTKDLLTGSMPVSDIKGDIIFAGRRAESELTKSLLAFSLKSLRSRASSVFSSSAGFRSIDSVSVEISRSRRCADAESIMGPVTPK